MRERERACRWVVISHSRNIFHQFRQFPMIVNRRWKTGNVRNDKNSVFESRLMESYDILRVRVNVRGEKSMVLLKIQSYAVINCYKNDAESASKINDTGPRRKDNETVIGSDLMVSNPRWHFSFLSLPFLSASPFFPWDIVARTISTCIRKKKEKKKGFCHCCCVPIETIHDEIEFIVVTWKHSLENYENINWE